MNEKDKYFTVQNFLKENNIDVPYEWSYDVEDDSGDFTKAMN